MAAAEVAHLAQGGERKEKETAFRQLTSTALVFYPLPVYLRIVYKTKEKKNFLRLAEKGGKRRAQNFYSVLSSLPVKKIKIIITSLKEVWRDWLKYLLKKGLEK